MGSLRNAWATYRLLARMKGASRWPIEKLRALQERRFRSLLEHAYGNVPLYRRLYDEAGFQPEDFRCLDDVKKVPTLTKQRLKATPAAERVAKNVNPEACATVSTSGSTGVPLRIYLGAEEVCWQRAAAWRILFEHGFRWTDRTLEIRKAIGPNFWLQRLGVAPKKWVSILESPESWATTFHGYRPQVVVAGASTLVALAGALRGSVPECRLIVSDSETLTPTDREKIREAFGIAPIDVYGLVELSNFAWECECRDGFHISDDTHLVQLDGAEDGPRQIIATDLGMLTMPIIRYETGDFVEWSLSPCPCGRTFSRLARLHGRKEDSVILPDGRRLFWPAFHEALAAIDELEQWQIVQSDRERLQLRLVARNPGVRERAGQEVRRLLPPSVQLKIDSVPTLQPPPGQKQRVVLSQLSPQP